LTNIPHQESRNDFCFIVGKNHYFCPWYVAAFLSPKICRNCSNDPTQTEFIVETADPNHQFVKIISLGRGETIEFTLSTLSFFISIAREFENDELEFAMKNKIDHEIKLSNVIPRLIQRSEFKFAISEEIEFLASHFYEFSLSSLSKVSFQDISSIVSHPSLKMKSEDFLYELINSRMNEDLSFFSVFEFVRFEYLSSATISDFSRIVCEHFDLLNVSILSAICVRLNHNISPQIFNSRLNGIEIVPNVSSPLEGIISYLTRKHGGNVHDRGIVTITSTEPKCSLFASLPPYHDSPNSAAKNAADLTADRFFFSKDAPKSMALR
jgi:hypothetical protein